MPGSSLEHLQLVQCRLVQADSPLITIFIYNNIVFCNTNKILSVIYTKFSNPILNLSHKKKSITEDYPEIFCLWASYNIKAAVIPTFKDSTPGLRGIFT
jgi:hypothetical protein